MTELAPIADLASGAGLVAFGLNVVYVCLHEHM